MLWVGVLFTESTDIASAHNTGGLLFGAISFFDPHVTHAFVDLLNEVLRKTGHFLGYGFLGLLVFFALRNTNRDRLRRLIGRTWGTCLRDLWRLEWSFIGVMAALGMATYDEIHQAFIPSRTGRWQDVLIDTSGAIVIQGMIYWAAIRKVKQDGLAKPQVELTSTQ